MRRKAGYIAVGLAAVGLLAGGAVVWRGAVLEREAEERIAALRSVVDTTVSAGWVQTFEAAEAGPLVAHDARWRPLFGGLLIDGKRQALIGDPQGGWGVDRGDDYAFRLDRPVGSAEMVIDGWWDGVGAIGVQGAVQAEAPHRLYEATLWRGQLGLIYFAGPGPTDFEYLARSDNEPLPAGHYRLVLRMERAADAWRLVGRVQDPANGHRTLAEVEARDARLGIGGQGIGILGGGASSYVTGIAVREL